MLNDPLGCLIIFYFFRWTQIKLVFCDVADGYQAQALFDPTVYTPIVTAMLV